LYNSFIQWVLLSINYCNKPMDGLSFTVVLG
jgi:hypothetical protein